MKYRTPKNKRATYFYTGKEAQITLRPGEDGVTEADIKARYRASDDEWNNDRQRYRTDRKIVKKVESAEDVRSEMALLDFDRDPTVDAVLSAEKKRIVREAVAKLPQKQAEAVTAVWLEGMTAREYAKATGKKENTVSELLKRAFENLKKLLAEFK